LLVAAAAWLLVNACVGLHWPQDGGWRQALDLLRLAPESLCLLALWLAVQGARLTGRGATVLISGAAVLLGSFRFADTLVAAFFHRPLNLGADLLLLPDLCRLLTATVAPVRLLGWALLAVAAVLGAAMLIAGALRKLQRGRPTPCEAVLLAALMTLLHTGAGRGSSGTTAPPILPRLVAELDALCQADQSRLRQQAQLAAIGRRVARFPRPLDGLEGVDVLVLFVESYGSCILDEPRFAPLASHLTALGARFSENGVYCRSRRVVAPTSGGSSWHSHASVECGLPVGNERCYRRLVLAAPLTLTRLFQQAGHVTLRVMPATTRPWPREAFFGCQRLIAAQELAYAGPEYGWSPMPDQFVLDGLRRETRSSTTASRFVTVMLSSSHAAFNLLPPVVDDWDTIGDGGLYHNLPMRTFSVIWPDLTHAGDAYAAAIAYELDILEQYVLRFAGPDQLIVILGDHPPPGPLAARSPDGRTVPVHVLSRRESLLHPFAARGYAPGMVPPPTPRDPPMASLFLALVEGFSSPPAKTPRRHAGGVALAPQPVPADPEPAAGLASGPGRNYD
jgi:hypothetical protein